MTPFARLPPILVGGFFLASAIAGSAAAESDDFAPLPPGPGVEATFTFCNPCHSVKLVAQQRLPRDIWDETLVWMVEEQGMAELELAEREAILDYLGTYLGRDVPR